MTNILTLPLVQITAVVGSDEDWIDAITFSNADGSPCDLTGIAFELDVSLDGSTSIVTASMANGYLSLVPAMGSSVNNALLINIPGAARGLTPASAGISRQARRALLTGFRLASRPSLATLKARPARTTALAALALTSANRADDRPPSR